MFIRTLPIILCAAVMAPAHAGWQYPGDYVGAGWYEDDGGRFIVSFRGGASFGTAKIENKLGSMALAYVERDEQIYPCTDDTCEGYIGYGEMGSLSPNKNFSSFSFAAGASVGFTLPYRPQWRMEASWDHISETNYNSDPLFDGEMEIIGSDGIFVYEELGAVESTVSTDIIGAMVFYDFYSGLEKPLQTFIPYVGLGIGYARSKTVTNLSDPNGRFSLDADMYNFGTANDATGILSFYRSETETGNFAAMVALGVSYGITESVFLDLGARVIYVPRIRWTLENADDTRHRDLFDATNALYGNVTMGIRFEF